MSALGLLAAVTAAGAAFVSPSGEPPEKTAAAVFEKSEVNASAVRRAVWSVTAQGVFEAYVNGVRVGDDFLKPGFTESGKCRHVYSYDVTDLLKREKGATNRLSATVAPGWWCDAMMTASGETPWKLGKKVAFRGELTLECEDGTRKVLGTDPSWKSAYSGPVVSAGIYEGEVYDARRKVGNLAPVEINGEFDGELRPAAARVVLRRDLELRPTALYVTKGCEGATSNAYGRAKIVCRAADGESVRLDAGELLVVDFGQNAAAVPSFAVSGAAGTTVTVRHAEMLNESNGERARGNDGPAGTPYLAALRSARAELRYTLGGDKEVFLPRHTFFGYRYLSVETTGPVEFSSIRSVPISSVTREMERGSIRTGNARVNRLIENIRWSVRSNYLSIPTDCPQRDERLGWTADTQVFMNSAAYLLDTYGFLTKYLADMRDAQFADGLYPCFVPNLRHVFDHGAAAGWTDAGVLIPYRLWKWYGRREVLDGHWDSMSRYMRFVETQPDPFRLKFGDWLSFEHVVKRADGSVGEAPEQDQINLMNDVFRVWMNCLMAEMASATGRRDEARRFAREEARCREVFRTRYLGADGCLTEKYRGQCNDLYAIKLGLCGSAAATEATKRDLVENIRSKGIRLQTGFLGTAILLPTLTFDVGDPGLAYDLLLQDKFPSWLYSVDQGATTVWERWNGYTKEQGFGPVNMNSFNHYAYGCVLEWLFSAAAGIRPDPKGGWRHFVLKPYPDRRLGSCEASYRSDHGTIRSAWKYDDDKLVWKFTVPSGTSAEVTEPDGRRSEFSPGDYERIY